MAIGNALVTGIRDAQAQLARMPELLRRRVATAQLRSGSAIAVEASRTVRRRSGALADAIGVEQDDSQLLTRVGIRRGRFRGQKPGPRGHLIEFGTRTRSAYPFMLPAVEREQPRYVERLKEAGRDMERDLSVGSLL